MDGKSDVPVVTTWGTFRGANKSISDKFLPDHLHIFTMGESKI